MESTSAHPTAALAKMTVDEIDEQKLMAITANAVGNVLYFHTMHLYPTSVIRESGVDNAVKAVFHLRTQAKDVAVAYMQIACDAAVDYAQEWNKRHPEDTIAPRWMYNCVQSLLSERLKPELIDALNKEKPIQRLKDWVKTQQKDAVSDDSPLTSGKDEYEDDDGYDGAVSIAHSRTASLTNMTSAADEDDDDDSEPSAASSIKGPKTPWTDDDISQMIELHAKGFTHLEGSVVLGRGVGAVENKYGRVAKEAAWKPYLAACATRFAAEKKRRRAAKRVAATRKRKLGAGCAKAGAGRGEDDEEDEDDVQSIIEVTAGAAAQRVGGYAKRRRVMTVAEAAGLE